MPCLPSDRSQMPRSRSGPCSMVSSAARRAPTTGYNYSPANKDSGIVWTPEELDKYLTSPQTVVPHTKMIFPGLKDEQKRKNVIAYLEQFGPDGQKKQ